MSKNKLLNVLGSPITWIILIGLGVTGVLIASLLPNEKIYPVVKSKYAYEDHLAHANKILELHPEGYVDTQDWIESRPYWFVTGLLELYDQRKDMKYLDMAVEFLNKFESRCQTDTDSDGYNDCKSYYTYDSNLRTAGYITDQFSRGVYIIKKNQVTKYQADADRWTLLLDNHFIPYFMQYWVPYVADGKQMGYFKPVLTGENSNRADQWNRDAGFATAMVWKYKVTGNKQYLDVPQRLLNRYFDPINNPRIVYHWNSTINPSLQYMDGKTYLSPPYTIFDPRSGEFNSCATCTGWSCGPCGLTDTSHLNAEFELVLVGYENGLITKQELQLLTNTIHIMMMEGYVDSKKTPVLNDATTPPRLIFPDETNKNIFRQTGHMYNFIRFGILEPNLVYDMEEILHNLELHGQLMGNYYSEFYRCVKDPRLNMLEQCAQDNSEGRIEDMEIFMAIVNLGRFQ